MGIKDKYRVQPIKKFECKEWFLKKHYAKRMPSISYAFGLFEGVCLQGVLSIGKPPSFTLCESVCGKEYSAYVYELNRLVVAEDLPKNTLSYFVSQSLKLIKNSMVLVSFADTEAGHTGYIYQATNWIYAGISPKQKYYIAKTDDAGLYRRRARTTKDDPRGVKEYFSSEKHRYIYFIGRKKKEFRKNLRYETLPYPKGDNKRYDASYEPITQVLLF